MSDQRETSVDGKASAIPRVTSRGSKNILNPYLDSSSKSGGIRQMHGRTSSTPSPQDERCADEEKQDQQRKVPDSPNKIQTTILAIINSTVACGHQGEATVLVTSLWGMFYAPAAQEKDGRDRYSAHEVISEVNKRQEKNPVLRYLRNVPFEVTPGLLADFVFSPKMCAVFISVRYHLLYPNYLIQRIKELSRHFTLRILLCHVDVHDCEKPLLDINKTAVLNDFTFILAWSLQEAARYLETYKAYELKSAESIQEKVDDDYLAKLQDCLGVIRSINKPDVLTLASNFGSFEAMCDASAEELALCPGVGDKKVTRIHEALHEPLSRSHRQKRIRQETEDT